jgi:hypothetical protein
MDVESKDLLVLRMVEPKKGEKFNKEGHILRVVKWIYEKNDGTTGESLSLEKRIVYLGGDGDIRNGKAKGLNKDDLNLVLSNWDKISAIMGCESVPF